MAGLCKGGNGSLSSLKANYYCYYYYYYYYYYCYYHYYYYYYYYYYYTCGSGSSSGKTLGYGLDVPGSIPEVVGI